MDVKGRLMYDLPYFNGVGSSTTELNYLSFFLLLHLQSACCGSRNEKNLVR